MVERRGAQGAVGEGGEGGAERAQANHMRAEVLMRAVWRLGGGASLGSGAQGGGCGAVPCSGGGGKHTLRRHCGPVPQAQPGRAAS